VYAIFDALYNITYIFLFVNSLFYTIIIKVSLHLTAMIDGIIENDLVFASTVHNLVDLGLKKNNSFKITLNHLKKI
jgi:hypothetical protein